MYKKAIKDLQIVSHKEIYFQRTLIHTHTHTFNKIKEIEVLASPIKTK